MSVYQQTLKSANNERVNVGTTVDQAATRMQGFYNSLCWAGAPDLQNDVYGRNVTQNTLDLRGGGAECNAYLDVMQTAEGHIIRENIERPYIQIAPEGNRGFSDCMGRGRDLMPEDLYGFGIRGNFVRHGYPGLTLSPYQAPRSRPPPIHRVEQNIDYPNTHDTTMTYYYQG